MSECKPKEQIQVLVIEDSPGDIRLFQESCARSASHFEFVRNGEQALDYLFQQGDYASTKRPDLIILDLNLPRIDGIEVLREIKKHSELCLLPVIVFSSSSSDDEIRDVYRGQVACVIKKPQQLDEFMEVCQAIDRFWIEFVCYPARRD
jgi:CheY-like chemotaxis protein